MTEPKRIAGMDIEEDAKTHRIGWRLERAGWVLMGLAVIAAAAGLFGGEHAALVGRAATIFLFLLLIVRIAGKRTMAEITTFDFILLLIVSEAVQEALTQNDPSVTGPMIAILTFFTLDIILSYLKQYVPAVERWLDGTPVILVRNGKLLHQRMKAERVDEADILEAARKQHGLQRMDQIKNAVLEKSGGITIVPA